MARNDELQSRIRTLELENKHLKDKLRLIGTGGRGSMFSVPEKLKSLPLSISGLESMYIQVDGNSNVINLNTKMADLIGSKKERILSRPLVEVDDIPWAKGIFQTLLRESRLMDDAVEFETSYRDPVSGLERHLQIRASHSGEVGNVTINDKTKYERILSHFQRYVSPVVIERMQNSTNDFFKTERAVITVLFADLRGFTAMSSGMTPDELKDTINEYLVAMLGVVDQYEGTVDKIVGDEVMALFGAPVPCDDHPFRAIKVGIEMQKAHQRLLEKWRSERRPAPPVGIGINTGDVVIGNIGCHTRTNYTALGYPVNLASRLCGAAAGGEILVSMNTADALARYAASAPDAMREKINFQKAGTIVAKGVSEPVPVAKVLYESK